MKNSDMPAMPQSFAMTELECGTTVSHMANDELPMNIGLTKREMIAKDIDVCSVDDFDNYKAMASFVGEVWNSSFNEFQNITLKLKVTAKLKVMAADALLEELEK